MFPRLEDATAQCSASVVPLHGNIQIVPPMSTEHSPTASAKQLTKLFHTARETFGAEAARAGGGMRACADYSAKIDHLLERIATDATANTDTPVTLIAIGGYGRRELCLHSDIDLLILFGNRLGADDEQLVKALLHPLWDLGLDVGHQVRHLAELEEVETDNPAFLVALADSRFLAGHSDLYATFDRLIHGPDSGWRRPTSGALRELVDERHRHFNTTIYQLEPDIKEAPGALRDINAIRTLTELAQRDATRTVPITAGRLDEALEEAAEFLLRIRSLLHAAHGRNLNVLDYEHQEKVAEQFGSPGSDRGRRAEALMSVYFHHARIVARILASTLGKTTPPRPKSVRMVADNVRHDHDGVSFSDNVRASLQPRTWLGVFQAAIDEECRVSGDTLAFIERHCDRYTVEDFFPSSAERDQLLHFFQPKPGLYERLSEMHENGMLGRMFPEFRKIYCRVIRDFYHKYTVDEHTLRTIRGLSELGDQNTPTRHRFASILAEVPHPEQIVLALLFHDVGKWTNKNHAEESVRMVRDPLRRLQVPPEAIRTIEFLIRHHLEMSQAAFRRDSEDPEVARQFARLVGTEDRLKMLCLLTVADIQAVSPETLTPWKEELLWRLYVDTYNQLTLGYGDELIATSQPSVAELRARRPAEISEEQVTQFLEGLPQRYLRLVDTGTVYDHIRLSSGLASNEVRTSLARQDDVWELSVITRDRPRIFSNICGVLSYFGMDILRGQAMSNRQGIALDLFRFVDADQFLALNSSGRAELTQQLQDVVTGAVELSRMLKGRESAARAKRRKFRIRSFAHFDHHYSDRYTVLEIGGENEWGLLYRVSRIISAHGCDIDLVLISTEGNRATDVFHLTRHGEKLPLELERDLRGHLETAMGIASTGLDH